MHLTQPDFVPIWQQKLPHHYIQICDLVSLPFLNWTASPITNHQSLSHQHLPCCLVRLHVFYIMPYCLVHLPLALQVPVQKQRRIPPELHLHLTGETIIKQSILNAYCSPPHHFSRMDHLFNAPLDSLLCLLVILVDSINKFH